MITRTRRVSPLNATVPPPVGEGCVTLRSKPPMRFSDGRSPGVTCSIPGCLWSESSPIHQDPAYERAVTLSEWHRCARRLPPPLFLSRTCRSTDATGPDTEHQKLHLACARLELAIADKYQPEARLAGSSARKFPNFSSRLQRLPACTRRFHLHVRQQSMVRGPPE